jgi:hypothetical protein
LRKIFPKYFPTGNFVSCATHIGTLNFPGFLYQCGQDGPGGGEGREGEVLCAGGENGANAMQPETCCLPVNVPF